MLEKRKICAHVNVNLLRTTGLSKNHPLVQCYYLLLRYLRNVVVRDLGNGRRWLFPAYQWLSLDHGTRRAYAELVPAFRTKRNLFFDRLADGLQNGCSWISLFYMWVPVLWVQKILFGFSRGTRRWPMYFPIRRSLPAWPEPDNTSWTDITAWLVERRILIRYSSVYSWRCNEIREPT